MPVQKGKRRRKPRRRGSSVGLMDDSGSVPVTPKPAPRPIMRRGMELPWWLNGVVGAGMLVVGVFFFATTKGSSGQRLVFLFLYVLLAGFFLAKAYRQRRALDES